jgi:predicted GNAT superfamily acetyltransferase
MTHRLSSATLSEMQVMGRTTDFSITARSAASDAAVASGIIVRELEDVGDLERLSKIYAEIWSAPDSMITPELLRALTHAGNYVAGAFVEGDLVGGIVGFLGMEEGRVILHSHILGVLPETQSRNAGFSLKQDQRAWALERGIEVARWTYDPLVSRNAYFNISKLGARASAYYPSFYGAMNDGVNSGDESDRVLVEWDLTGKAATSASLGQHSSPRMESLLSKGARTILEEFDGFPRINESDGATVLLCVVPRDIVAMRNEDFDLALAWRRALRSTLGTALTNDFVVDSFSRAGCYVLTRP